MFLVLSCLVLSCHRSISFPRRRRRYRHLRDGSLTRLSVHLVFNVIIWPATLLVPVLMPATLECRNIPALIIHIHCIVHLWTSKSTSSAASTCYARTYIWCPVLRVDQDWGIRGCLSRRLSVSALLQGQVHAPGDRITQTKSLY